MEASFKFVLPEEDVDHRIYVHAKDYYCVIVEIINILKQKLDHDVDTGRYRDNQLAALEDFKDEFYEELESRGVNTHFQ